LLPKIGEAFNW